MRGKVLITGGAGFIGRRIVEKCIQENLEVRVFDLVETKNPNVRESILGSILDPYEISVAARGCDFIIHAAAALGVQRTESNRLECLYINIQGTVNVLEAAVKERVRKVVFTSSSEVYGDGPGAAFDEGSPLNPKSNYAITKLVGEEYLCAYKQTYGLDYSIVRFFNIYGEGQTPRFVVPRFVNAVKNGRSPVIFGDGHQVRSFCHVDDAARGTVLALLSDKSNNQIYNIGNDRESITIQELANKIILLSGNSIQPRIVGYAESDRDAKREIYRRIPVIAKAKADLGYEPTISLLDGLRCMLNTPQETSAAEDLR